MKQTNVMCKNYYTTTTDDRDAVALAALTAGWFEFEFWSGARDLNPGPHGPEPCALPNCASPRRSDTRGKAARRDETTDSRRSGDRPLCRSSSASRSRLRSGRRRPGSAHKRWCRPASGGSSPPGPRPEPSPPALAGGETKLEDDP